MYFMFTFIGGNSKSIIVLSLSLDIYKKYIFVSITKSEVSGKYYTIFCFNIK